MSIRMCQHVKVDGTLCQVPPLNGRHYCLFHLEAAARRRRMARSRALREDYYLVLPILEDLNSVTVARQHVMDALGAGLLPHKVAGQLLFGLQGIANDLRSAHPPRLGVYDPAVDTAPRATEYPNLEEKYGLPNDVDLSQPPEVVFAAEAAAVAVTQAAPSPYRSPLFQHDYVSPEDVELEEIFEKEGEEAYRKREHELNQKAMQKVWERRREVQRAQYIVEAARRNTEIICGTPEERARVKAEIQQQQAEASAKRKAELEAALVASGQLPPPTASGAAAAGKSPAGEPTNGDAPPATSEAGKKPPEAAPDAATELDAARRRDLARQLEALEQLIKAKG
jgi:hypothetical protein